MSTPTSSNALIAPRWRHLALLAVLCFVIATGTTLLASRSKHRPRRATGKDRRSSVIGKRGLLALDRKALPNPRNAGHQPFFLANTEGRITDFICQRCKTTEAAA